MRASPWLMLTLLFAAWAPAFAQKADPVTLPKDAEWVGPMEFRNSGGLNLAPTKATLHLTATSIDGDWSAGHEWSGRVTGTIDKNRKIKLRFTFFSGAVQTNATTGKDELTAVERCQGEGTLDGLISSSGVLRFTAPKIAFDTTVTRARDRQCEDVTNVLWMLQLRQ